jgi:DNA-binding MarR family transcriptional regulator
MECVYREPSPDDGRIIYIRLTEKGRKIAQADNLALRRMMLMMMESLEEPDQELLIGLLEKVR